MAVNNVVLIGRLCTDVKTGVIGDNVKQAKFTVAVDRRYKRKGAERPDTDFIKVNATRFSAEFAEKYFTKGKQVSVEGSIETYSYEKEGRTIYDFCVKADRVGFADSAGGGNNRADNSISENNIMEAEGNFDAADGFDFAPQGDFASDDLPF